VADNNSERKYDQDEEGKEDRYILVAGFTKEAAYQFLRIRQHKDGSIYISFTYRGIVEHFSYHANGEKHHVYVNQQGQKITNPTGYGQPLAEFRGQDNLGVWVVSSPIRIPLWKSLTVEKKRKTQAIFCFDMSRLSGQLNMNISLLESGRVDLLPEMVRAFPLELPLQFLVITATDPWVVIRATTV
jgi:hypothetical protein